MALPIARIGYNGVGLDPPVKIRVVVSRVVKVQPDCSIFPLACKAPRGGCRAGAEARLAPGSIQQLAQFRTAAVGGDVCPAQSLP